MRYVDVEFEFLCPEQDLTERGIVILRDGEMVLEVECNGDPIDPYLICGKAERGFFQGRHKGKIPEDVTVDAKWTRLDDIYIGIWTEDGEDYFFKFRLSAQGSA
jgi:hypothetical protein